MATSVVLWPVAHLGVVYGVSAVLLGALFLREAYLLRNRVHRGAAPAPMRLFHWSITYLSLLSAAIVADVLLRPWT